MKLDLDYIKTILLIIEENEEPRTELGIIISQLNENNVLSETEVKIGKLYGHLKLICDSNFLDCESESYGIRFATNGGYVIASAVTFEMTMQGYQMLDAFRNETLLQKIKSHLIEAGVSGLKSAPALVMGIIINKTL